MPELPDKLLLRVNFSWYRRHLWKRMQGTSEMKKGRIEKGSPLYEDRHPEDTIFISVPDDTKPPFKTGTSSSSPLQIRMWRK
jgi:hypothetical protein